MKQQIPNYEEQMKAARKRAIQNKECDGSVECKAAYHLICCLSLHLKK